MEPVLNQSYGWIEKTQILKESRSVNVGDKFYGYYYDEPEVGQRFNFFIITEILAGKRLPRPFSTTKVVKIEDEFTFRTTNSVYKLISKEKLRDINIDLIVNEKDTD